MKREYVYYSPLFDELIVLPHQPIDTSRPHYLTVADVTPTVIYYIGYL